MHKPLDSLNDTQSSSVTIQKCMIKPKTGCNDNNSDDKKKTTTPHNNKNDGRMTTTTTTFVG